MEPWRRDPPLECSEGTRAGERHERSGGGEPAEVAHLGSDGEGRQCLDASEAPEHGHRLGHRGVCRRFLEPAVDGLQLGSPGAGGGQEVPEGRLGVRLVEPLCGHPPVEGLGPPSAARRGAAVAEQEAPDPLAGPPPVVLEILSDPHQVPERLLFGGGDPDRGELAGAVELGQVACVEPVGLHSLPGATRGERRSDDVAGHAEASQGL